jgi:hypothetical protein
MVQVLATRYPAIRFAIDILLVILIAYSAYSYHEIKLLQKEAKTRNTRVCMQQRKGQIRLNKLSVKVDQLAHVAVSHPHDPAAVRFLNKADQLFGPQNNLKLTDCSLGR